MNASRRLFIGATLAAALPRLHAQTTPWPSRPVMVTVPFSAGGPADVGVRLVLQKVAEAQGQPFVFESKVGAGGNIAAAAVSAAAADGYTLLAGTASLMTAKGLYRKLSFDPQRSLVPISLMASAPVFIWVNQGFPANMTLQDVLAAMRAAPGKYNYSSSSPSTLMHLGSLMLLEKAGVQATHINYKGSAQATNDFIAGVFPLHFEVGQTMVPHIASGKVRALAVMGSKRSPLMPQVPSTAELGYPGMDVQPYFGLFAPAATPPAIVGRLNREIRRVMEMPDVRTRLASLYLDPMDQPEPPVLAERFEAESARWLEVIRKNNLSLD